MRLTHCFCNCPIVLPPCSSIQFIFYRPQCHFFEPLIVPVTDSINWEIWGGPGSCFASVRARVKSEASVTMLLSDRWPGPAWPSSGSGECLLIVSRSRSRSPPELSLTSHILVWKRKLNHKQLRVKWRNINISTNPWTSEYLLKYGRIVVNMIEDTLWNGFVQDIFVLLCECSLESGTL